MKTRSVLLATVAVLALAGCSSDPTADPYESSPVSESPTVEYSPEPLVSEEPPPSESESFVDDEAVDTVPMFGKPGRLEKVTITTTDGYSSVVKIRWHKTKKIDFSDLSATCKDQISSDVTLKVQPEEGNEEMYTFHATSIEVEGEFPDSNGFSWPDGWESSVSLRGRGALTSCNEVTPIVVETEGFNGIGTALVSPDSPTEVMTIIEIGKKTPSEPKGITDPDDSLSVHFDIPGSIVDCVNPTADPDWISACNSDYREAF